MAIFAIDQNKTWGVPFAYALIFLLISSGTRAGFGSVVIAFCSIAFGLKISLICYILASERE